MQRAMLGQEEAALIEIGGDMRPLLGFRHHLGLDPQPRRLGLGPVHQPVEMPRRAGAEEAPGLAVHGLARQSFDQAAGELQRDRRLAQHRRRRLLAIALGIGGDDRPVAPAEHAAVAGRGPGPRRPRHQHHRLAARLGQRQRA